MLGFIKLPDCFPKWLYHLAFPPAMNESSYCSTSPSVGAVSVLDFDHSNRCVVVSHCCFNLHFPDDICCGASFHMLIYHLYILFGEVSVQVFGLFFNQVICFLIIECWVFFFFIFWITLLYQICLLQIFSPRLWLIFSFSWHCILQSRSF